MVPEGESPLLLPANKHKQLVVIDFEYANANLPGLEFANHFVSLSYLFGVQPSMKACGEIVTMKLIKFVDGMVIQLP